MLHDDEWTALKRQGPIACIKAIRINRKCTLREAHKIYRAFIQEIVTNIHCFPMLKVARVGQDY